MADPQYTNAQLSDGTVLKLRGQLSPDEVAAKVKAFRSTQAPVQPHGASTSWGPEIDPPNPTLAKIGHFVPEAAAAPLSWLQQHYVDPAEKYLSTVGSVGRELGRETLGMGSDPNVQKKYGMEKSVPLHTALGAAGAVGSVAATTVADPRNWPLMASSQAKPILQRLMSGGFAAQMGKGAYDAADDLSRNWEKYSVEERAEKGVAAGINTLMAAASARHATTTELQPTHTEAPEADVRPPATEPKPNVLRTDTTPPQALSTKGLSDPSTVAKSDPVSLTRTASASVTPPAGEPGEGFRMPKTGEVIQEQYNRSYPNKEEMTFRSFKKLEYTQRELQKAVNSGDQDAIDAAHKRVVGDALTWAEYATPDDINQAMRRMHAENSILATQLRGMKDLYTKLQGGKVTFYQTDTEGVETISRKDFQSITGTALPKIPKDFVNSLPAETLKDLKGRTRQETITRLWASDFLQQQGTKVKGNFDRLYELEASIGVAKGFKVPPKGFYANAPAPETPISAEVGGDAATAAESRPAEQPIQAAEATTGPGEPVRAPEGPEVTEAVNMNRRIADYIAKTDAVRAEIKSGSEPPSGLKDEASLNAAMKKAATPQVDTNFFALAQTDLRTKLGREPSISEVAQHAAILKGKLAGIEDPRLEEKIQTLLKKGVARGTAERIAKDQLTEEKREAEIREAQAAKPGERGSLSFRRLQPQIGPLGPSPAWKLAHFIDRLAVLGGLLERSPEEELTRDITRKHDAELKLEHLRLEEKFKEALARHDHDTTDEMRTFMDAGEGKIAQGPVNWAGVSSMQSPHPQAPFMRIEDVATAQELHSYFQERWATIQKILDKVPGGIENYMAHLWERPGLGKTLLNKFWGKRPLEGKSVYLKQRFYEYFSDGLDAGLKPITNNPIRMQLTALYQMDKFIAAHELKDMYAAANLIDWVTNTEHPVDWVPLNDKIFQPKVMQDGLLGQYGQWMAPRDVAKIFNRYVTPGLRGHPTYDMIRQYGNFQNAMNLAVSGFHFFLITGVSAAADVGEGLGRLANNFDPGGFKNIARGTLGQFLGLSAIRDYQFGKKIAAEAISPTGNKNLQAYVDDLLRGGEQFGQDPMYRSYDKGKEFINQIKSGKLLDTLQGIANGTKFGADNIPWVKFTREKYVPYIKLGIASHRMESRMQFLIKQGITDPAVISNELGKIVDSVDNVAGQLKYDNLFWNKTAKDISFLAMRAVGWTYGTLREGGGAAKDTLQQTAKLIRGERPELTQRMGFVLGLAISQAVIGGITYYLASGGKAPQKPEDYYYPYTGRIGPDGKPERGSYASYVGEYYSFKHGPVTYAASKLHPSLNTAWELLVTNKDFYNTEIRSEGDPVYRQGLQVLGHIGKSYLPFAATMGYQRYKQGVPPLEAFGEAMVGIRRAPSYVTQSPAEEMTLDFSKRNWKAGPLTTDEREQRDTYNRFKAQIAMRQLDTKAVSQAFTSGKLREQDLDRLFDDQGLSSFQQEFKSLHLKEALKVMQVARPEERQELKILLLDKEDEIEDMPVPEERAYYLNQIQKYLQ